MQGATVTTNSKVDIQPTNIQLSTLTSDGVVALIAENDDGIVTVYCIGEVPSSQITLQCTVTEVEV